MNGDKKIENLYQKFLEKIKKLDKKSLLKEMLRISEIDKDKFSDLSFCILLIFWTELILKKVLNGLLLNAMKPEKRYPELINLILDETTFISKIKITEFIISGNPQYKRDYRDFFSFCKTLNEVRNQIFHAKLNNITYKGLSISKLSTQKAMLKDLIKARLKMGVNL